ncbi:MAG: hypothetical protein WCJ64_07315 [Rhodospirillaceae bacterium]
MDQANLDGSITIVDPAIHALAAAEVAETAEAAMAASATVPTSIAVVVAKFDQYRR